MFARFEENPAMNLQDIKETKHYRRTHALTDNMKTVYQPQTKFAGDTCILIIDIYISISILISQLFFIDTVDNDDSSNKLEMKVLHLHRICV